MRAPSTSPRLCRLENRPSRARSEVGLVTSPIGTCRRRPRASPAMIRVTDPTVAAVKRSGGRGPVVWIAYSADSRVGRYRGDTDGVQMRRMSLMSLLAGVVLLATGLLFA